MNYLSRSSRRLVVFVGLTIVMSQLATSNNMPCEESTCKHSISVNITEEECTCYKNNSDCPTDLWDNAHYLYSSTTNFPVTVNMTPLRRGSDGTPHRGVRSSLSMNFTIKEDWVKGLAFCFLKNCWTNAITYCRYFDWSSSKTSLVGATLLYDKVVFDTNKHEAFCNLEVAALSSKCSSTKKVNYLFKILNSESIIGEEKLDICDWRSLIMIDRGSYNTEMKSVLVSFSTAPPVYKELNLEYVVWLIKCNDQGICNDDDTTWFAVIRNVTTLNEVVEIFKVEPNVNYVIKVELIARYCKNHSKSSTFNFKPSEESVAKAYQMFVITTTLYVLLGVFIFVGAVFMICATIYNYRKSHVPLKGKVRVMFVYNRDIGKHIRVVKLLANYLFQYCRCEVLLDEWGIQDDDPHAWVNKCLTVSDYVVIIWSRGAQMKVDRQKRRILACDEGFLGNDLFSNCFSKINARIEEEHKHSPFYWNSRRRFINVSLPYVPKFELPSCLTYMKHYHIPRDFNTFLCHLHDIVPPFCLSTVFKCLYPDLPFPKLPKNEEGRNLLVAIQDMQRLEDVGLWFEDVVEYKPEWAPRSVRLDSCSSGDKLLGDDSSGSNQIPTDLSEVEDDIEIVVPRFPPDLDNIPGVFGLDEEQAADTPDTVANQKDEDDGLPLELIFSSESFQDS